MRAGHGAMLDAAETLADLLVPPGNRLEKLTGDRGGRASGSTGSGESASAGPTPPRRMSRSLTITERRKR